MENDADFTGSVPSCDGHSRQGFTSLQLWVSFSSFIRHWVCLEPPFSPLLWAKFCGDPEKDSFWRFAFNENRRIKKKNFAALLLAFWKMGGLTRSKDQRTVGVCCQQTICEVRLGSHIEYCLVPPKPVYPLTIPVWTNYVIGVAKGDFLIFFCSFYIYYLNPVKKSSPSLHGTIWLPWNTVPSEKMG